MNRKLKIKVFGAKAFWCQVKRIEEGFRGLGHEITNNDDDADFVYCNNPPFDRGDEEHKDSPLDSKAFKIFNVLDISANKTEDDKNKLRDDLDKANIVTCISKVTQDQLREIGVRSIVIDNPIKEITLDKSRSPLRKVTFVYVGRANDSNKRFELLKNLEEIDNIIVVGNERPSFGNYGGPVSDVLLNQIYNDSKFVLLPSKFEGLGLPALEAMAAGSIPIVCNDNPNSVLCPEFCRVDPNPNAIYHRVETLLKDYDRYRQVILDDYTYQVQHKYSKFTVAQNIINCFDEYWEYNGGSF